MLSTKTKDKKVSTTFKLKSEQRPQVKKVVAKYGYNATDVHQMLEDYIALTNELPLFLLNPKRKEPINTINYAEYDIDPETGETPQTSPIRLGYLLTQKLQH
jgi:antitoxin component of RelBE/YafQ-DinJ toxin-antitoxin module